jgi:GTPase Era involved in 16S rRNA processing
MNLSVKQQTHRGRKANVDEKIDYIWSRIQCRDNQYAYEINRDSQFLNLIKQKLSDDDMDYLEMFIEEVERNLPVQQIYIDRANNEYTENEVDDRDSDLKQKAIIMIQTALKYGSKPLNEIIKAIMSSEPFCYSKNLETELKKHFKHENK